MRIPGSGSKFGDWRTWLVRLGLAVGVLLPIGGVLWFMNEAARSQAEAARQSVQEAYRGQLRLLRDRLDADWVARATALGRAAADQSASRFPVALAASGADAVLFLDANGLVQYPAGLNVPTSDPVSDLPEWQDAEALEHRSDHRTAAAAYTKLAQTAESPAAAARAARAAVRCLVRVGRIEEALASIERYFIQGRASRGSDLDGRLIGVDEQLLALQLMKRTDRRFTMVAQRLAGVLNRYDGDPIPSAQRVFAMQELRELAPEVQAPTWLAAERLGLAFLESEQPRPGQPALAATYMANVWKLTSPNRRVIALYRTPTVVAAGRLLLAKPTHSPAVEFGIAPPGATISGDGIAAGSILPGWQIWFSLLNGDAVDEAARQRMTTILWVGYCVIAGVMVAGLILAQSFRHQSRLSQMKTDLVATVSHELKTPLASMRLLVETLLEDENVPPTTAREYLEMIAGENQRLTRLIDNFLTFSRIERSRQRFSFCSTDPAEVVETALRCVRDRLQLPGCCLEVDVAAGLPAIRADQDALVTVLMNLLDNALKYTREEKHLALRAYADEGHVVFVVEDNGIGIALREQRRIFRSFYQVDRRLARETGGCGLGLSIVEFIVRAHEGEVRVKSAPGEGSTFSVLLPCPAAAGEAHT